MKENLVLIRKEGREEVHCDWAMSRCSRDSADTSAIVPSPNYYTKEYNTLENVLSWYFLGRRIAQKRKNKSENSTSGKTAAKNVGEVVPKRAFGAFVALGKHFTMHS